MVAPPGEVEMISWIVLPAKKERDSAAFVDEGRHSPDYSRQTSGQDKMGLQPFRNEGMPFGIANGKSQIPNYEI